MIKAIIFDVDGVLIDSFKANLKFFTDLMPKFGYPAPTKEEYMAIFHMPMIDVIKTLSKSQSNEEIEKMYKAGMSREIDYNLLLLKMPDQAKETIQTLSKKYKLGIVTGRIRKSVFEGSDLARLKKCFKVVVAYEDTVNHKPDPEPLLLAAEKLAVFPKECVYIGDAENDIAAARAARMKSILYSKVVSTNANAHTSVFAELPKIIETLK
jgi:pyrophosphatase PpaX